MTAEEIIEVLNRRSFYCASMGRTIIEEASFEDVADEIQEQWASIKTTQESSWVSVDTRLPEVGESFLYFFISKVDKKKHQAVGRRTDDNINKFLNSGMTHWQPLPPNPTK